jgi:hypothetical protein
MHMNEEETPNQTQETKPKKIDIKKLLKKFRGNKEDYIAALELVSTYLQTKTTATDAELRKVVNKFNRDKRKVAQTQSTNPAQPEKEPEASNNQDDDHSGLFDKGPTNVDLPFANPDDVVDVDKTRLAPSKPGSGVGQVMGLFPQPPPLKKPEKPRVPDRFHQGRPVVKAGSQEPKSAMSLADLAKREKSKEENVEAHKWYLNGQRQSDENKTEKSIKMMTMRELYDLLTKEQED